MLSEEIVVPLFPIERFPEALFIRVFLQEFSEIFPLCNQTETQELEISTHSTFTVGIVFAPEFSSDGVDDPQETIPRKKKDIKRYFIKRIVYKIDGEKYRDFSP